MYFITRFWYESLSTFKPQQIDQIKQTSLARIICDNGDDMTSITANPFLNMQNDTGNVLISCSEISSVSLDMWSGNLRIENAFLVRSI